MNRSCIVLLLICLACSRPQDSNQSGVDSNGVDDLVDLQVAEEAVLDEFLAQYVPYKMFYDASESKSNTRERSSPKASDALSQAASEQ